MSSEQQPAAKLLAVLVRQPRMVASQQLAVYAGLQQAVAGQWESCMQQQVATPAAIGLRQAVVRPALFAATIQHEH